MWFTSSPKQAGNIKRETLGHGTYEMLFCLVHRCPTGKNLFSVCVYVCVRVCIRVSRESKGVQAYVCWLRNGRKSSM